MEINYKKQQNTLTFYLSGELDEFTAPKAKTLIDKVINGNSNNKNVVFEMSNITFMDSTGIGLLIGRYKKLKELSINGYISNASVQAEKVLTISGIYSLMPRC